jgi:uncharacterized membrane protein
MARGTVDRYLHDLDEELRDLPDARRKELLGEIREHIDSALAEEPPGDEADVRNVLERLGEPADIAEEARQRFGIVRAKPGLREILAVILLPIGGVIVPVLGWIVGAILLATSNVWTGREKVIGLLLVPGGLLPAMAFGLGVGGPVCQVAEVNGEVVSETCTGGAMPVAFAYLLMAVLVLVPIGTTIFLATRLNRRARVA